MPPTSKPWLFFDAGNVIVSDDPSGCQVLRELYRVIAAADAKRGLEPESPESFMARRTSFTLDGGQLWQFVASHAARLPGWEWRPFQRAVRRWMYQPEVWSALSPSIPGMPAVLHRLKRAGFNLGLVANQPPAIEPVLRRRGLWHLFDVHAVSDVVGHSKPDSRLFEYALAKAGARAADCLMVGDRIDNDIAPAKALGMRTAWVVFDEATRGWQPSSRFGRAYLASVAVASVSTRQPKREEEIPDLRADSPAQLLKVLMDLA